MTDATAAGEPTRRRYEYIVPNETRGVVIEIDDSRDSLLTEFGKLTMRDRYLKEGENYQDMFARVACANSDEAVWGVDNGHAQRLYDYISQLWFMPATPVLSNSGVERGLPISCFLNKVEDNMESIAEAVYENIWLAAGGGGIGTSWSPVRSIGELIGEGTTSVGKTSGIIPFIQHQDAQTLAISQGSLRRGSAAAYLDVSHPEIEEFLDLRRHSGGDPRRKAHNIHHGVMVPDEFMELALKDDAAEREWHLKSPKTGKTIKKLDARQLLIKILSVRMEMGEPYIIFSDAVSRGLPEVYEQLGLECTQSNLCSEITLHTGLDYAEKERTAVCCLSSLNFAKMYEWMGDDRFVEDVLRFLDNVLENFIIKARNRTGYERAVYAASSERSVGLGMMGLHTMFQSLGMMFESKDALQMSDSIWKFLKTSADKANEKLAQERGPCPDAVAAGLNIRLSHMFSVAPTASISIICGGVSACGEPIPANAFTQKTLSGSYTVRNPALDKLLRQRFKEVTEIAGNLPTSLYQLAAASDTFGSILTDVNDGGMTEDEWIERQWSKIVIDGGSVAQLPYLTHDEKVLFRTAFEMDQRWLIEHAAIRQPYICQAQSTNIFLPADVSKQDLWDIHKIAWERGLKSLYYLRSRSLSRAYATNHMAGEMPKAETVSSGPLYEGDLTCESCQ